MIKIKYWLLSIVGAICCVQQSEAQSITVLTTDGDSKIIMGVDSIQLFDSSALKLTMLKADHSSVKFQVSAPQNAHWAYTLIPTAYYSMLKHEQGYSDSDFLREGALKVGAQIVEIKDGDALPQSSEWWDGKYSIKPGTAYCLLVAMVKKGYQWKGEQGSIAWGPVVSGMNSNSGEQGNAPFVPDYTNDIRLGNFLSETTEDGVTYEGFFYQQYFWTAAPEVAAEAPVVSVSHRGHTAISYTVALPDNVHKCKALVLSDEEYAALLETVGEYGIDAYVLANGNSVEAGAEITAESLVICCNYHILAVASFDEQGKVQSVAHQEVKTLSATETEADGSMPIEVIGHNNAYSEQFVVGDYRNDSIADPFNVPAFTHIGRANSTGGFGFATIFPTLAPGNYKVSAIIVPSAYHLLLKEGLVNSMGEPYEEQVVFTPRIVTGQATIETSSKVSAPNDRVEKVVLFENLEINGDAATTDAACTLEFEVATRDAGTPRAPKCMAINIYKIIIEPCEATAAQ